jgi:hypothetical protein
MRSRRHIVSGRQYKNVELQGGMPHTGPLASAWCSSEVQLLGGLVLLHASQEIEFSDPVTTATRHRVNLTLIGADEHPLCILSVYIEPRTSVSLFSISPSQTSSARQW